MNTPLAHTRVEAGNPEYFPFLSAERLVSIAAVGLLVASVFVVYARGFISLSADEFAKAVVAWEGLDNPRLWFRPYLVTGTFPAARHGIHIHWRSSDGNSFRIDIWVVWWSSSVCIA